MGFVLVPSCLFDFVSSFLFCLCFSFFVFCFQPLPRRRTAAASERWRRWGTGRRRYPSWRNGGRWMDTTQKRTPWCVCVCAGTYLRHIFIMFVRVVTAVQCCACVCRVPTYCLQVGFSRYSNDINSTLFLLCFSVLMCCCVCIYIYLCSSMYTVYSYQRTLEPVRGYQGNLPEVTLNEICCYGYFWRPKTATYARFLATTLFASCGLRRV